MNSTTTSHFQKKPDFFPSVKECLLADKSVVNTNPRYKYYNQTHFTAGDIEQFQKYRDQTNGTLGSLVLDLSNNVYSSLPTPIPDWIKYKNLTPEAVSHTFSYLFHKFKKGIFVKVKDKNLSVFLPFSKKNYTNEFHDRIEIDPVYTDLYGFIKYIQTKEGYTFSSKAVNRFTDCWYANNCLVRYEYPLYEGDTNIPITSDMFLTLCKERVVPDVEFFVNRRDFPMLRMDGKEAYNHLFGDQPLLSHDYDCYSPVLSMVGGKNFADIPIPTGEDWARVCRTCNPPKFFSKTCKRDYTLSNTPWSERKAIAVFRGASTGVGVDINTNKRLKLAFMSSQNPKDTDSSLLLDAGITEWNLRPRAIEGMRYLQTIKTETLPFGLVQPLTPAQQSQFKYVVNVEGHVSAYRLSLELQLGFCVLLVESNYTLWYSHLLIPYTHYVPVKADLSDLLEKIIWCKRNDEKCEQMSKNAKEFAERFLSREGILDYLQVLLIRLKKMNGNYRYNNISLSELQKIREERELKTVLNLFPDPSKKNSDLVRFPVQNRSYGFLHGIELVVRKCIFENPDIFNKGTLLLENKATKIEKVSLAGINVLKKSGENSVLHEAFITITSTNALLKQIPNFAYTFGTYDNNLIMEYIPGSTLFEYVQSPEFCMTDYLFILLQISLALQVAQNTIGFVHHDLTPWNCILHRVSPAVFIDYIIAPGVVYSVRTGLVPVFIDFTRSHVVHNDIHYGVNDMFKISTIQDVLTVLSNSIYEISNRELAMKDQKDIITLSNFISNTTYRRKRFHLSGKGGMGDVRYFFGKAKKYSELVSSNKYELESKTPLDLFNYIQTHFQYTFKIVKTELSKVSFFAGDAQQVFDYAFTSEWRKQLAISLAVFNRVKNLQSVNDHTELFELYKTIQTAKDILFKHREEQCTVLYKDALNNLKKLKTQLPIVKPIKIPNKTLKYDESIFLYPEKVKKLLLEHPDKYKSENDELVARATEDNPFKPNTPFQKPSLYPANTHTLHVIAKELAEYN